MVHHEIFVEGAASEAGPRERFVTGNFSEATSGRARNPAWATLKVAFEPWILRQQVLPSRSLY